MIELIYPTHEGYQIIDSCKEKIMTPSDLKWVRTLHYHALIDFNGRKKALSHFLNLKRNIPFYIDEGCCLMVYKNIRDADRIWINIPSVLFIIKEKDTIHIDFKSGHSYTFKDSSNRFYKRFQTSEKAYFKIKDYLTFR